MSSLETEIRDLRIAVEVLTQALLAQARPAAPVSEPEELAAELEAVDEPEPETAPPDPPFVPTRDEAMALAKRLIESGRREVLKGLVEDLGARVSDLSDGQRVRFCEAAALALAQSEAA